MSKIVRGLGAKATEVANQIVIRATKTGDKGVTVFHNLDADAISEVYISDSALRQPKDSGNAKMLVACLRCRVITMSVLFRHIYKQPHPLPA